jgi:predicted kinase
MKKKMSKKIILTRGIQGSGKSTWARKWVEEDPEHRIRINNDDIRNMLGVYWVTSREGLVSHIKTTTATTAMRQGYDIVVDNMNLNPKEIKFWEDIVNRHNREIISSSSQISYEYEIEFKDFFIPLEECIRRDAMRPNPIGEKVIRETWRRYKHFIQTSEVERYVNNLIKEDESKPWCVVVDMDSTLCFNTTKRPWFGEGSTEAMINDTPNLGVIKVIENQSLPIIVCTGRNKAQREVTEKWLSKYNIHPKEFYMREDGDYRKGVEIKEELIRQILDKYNIAAIFEDCEPIVQRFRDMGLTVLQPNKGL